MIASANIQTCIAHINASSRSTERILGHDLTSLINPVNNPRRQEIDFVLISAPSLPRYAFVSWNQIRVFREE